MTKSMQNYPVGNELKGGYSCLYQVGDWIFFQGRLFMALLYKWSDDYCLNPLGSSTLTTLKGNGKQILPPRNYIFSGN